MVRVMLKEIDFWQVRDMCYIYLLFMAESALWLTCLGASFYVPKIEEDDKPPARNGESML